MNIAIYGHLRQDLLKKRDAIDASIKVLDGIYFHGKVAEVKEQFDALAQRVAKAASGNNMSTRDRVLAYLAKHPRSRCSDIGATLGRDRNLVNYHLLRLKKAGRVRLHGHGPLAVWSCAEGKNASNTDN